MDKYKKDKHPNIRSFTQNQGVGKTLEYQMAFENENNSLLLTPSIQNQSELKDIIGLLVFLLSDSSSFLTGQNIGCDGGAQNGDIGVIKPESYST